MIVMVEQLPVPLRPGLDELLAALDASAGATRYVGGAVRDGLIGRPFSDVDLATQLTPEDAWARLKAGGIRVVPTGLKHGTLTALAPSGPVEVTTLRRDLSTDGRHAVVAFSDNWREDAARRDFTINALYADPIDGTLHDWFDGRADLVAGRVRFIGDAEARIAEDHLRILRFFRFHARYGRGVPDAEGLAACMRRANDLMALSRERIADELLKLLGGPNPVPTIRLMHASGIFAPVLPEINEAGVDRLDRLVAAEGRFDVAGDAVRRLAALLPDASAEAIARRLRLSNVITSRIGDATGPVDANRRAMAYRLGSVAAADRLLMAGEDLGEVADWQPPRLPIGGGVLISRGLSAGPAVARALRQVEDRWIAEGFPAADRVNAIAESVVAQALSAESNAKAASGESGREKR